MICQKCNANIVLTNSKFCPECGAKIEPLPKTPDLKKVFTGVTNIQLGVGSEFSIMPSNTNETTIVIKASEELKKQLKIDLRNGTLTVEKPSSSQGGISISGIHGGSISIGGSFIGGKVMIGNNNIFVGDGNVSINGNTDVFVTITTPVGVDVSIDSSGGIKGTIGDLKSSIGLDTSGGCRFNIGAITDFDADVSGSLNVNIASFEGGKCNVDVSGNCNLTVRSGKIEKLIVDVSGGTMLNVNSETEKAVLDVSGSLTGTLRADIVRKDVAGHDSLTIIR